MRSPLRSQGVWDFCRAASLLAIILVCRGIGARSAMAQTGEIAARDRMYTELAREVAALEQQGSVLKKVVRLVKPNVVHIEAIHPGDDAGRGGRTKQVEEAGSGVVIEYKDKFYVLTNRHVIKNAALNKIKVKLSDGRQTNPTKVWADKGTDIAIMAVSTPGLIPARLGDSSKLEIGDFVLAIGSPFNLSHSVTYGIISALGRRDLELGDDGVTYQDFLQTDAAINPGNSGGPLLNLRGEVIGINTAIASQHGGSEGIGFTIPINMTMLVARQLIERGTVSHAYLGVRLDLNFGPEAAARLGLPRPEGARVSGIVPKSPAETAELKIGDVILEFDGVRIEDDNHLVTRVSLSPVDEELPLLIFRDGKPLALKVRVGQREKFEPQK